MRNGHTHASADFRGAFLRCQAAAVSIALTCLSLMLSPLVNYSKDKGSTLSGILLSVATWALVIASTLLVQRVSSFAAHQAHRDKSPAGAAYRRSRIGLLTLAANPEGLIAEIVFVLGLVVWLLRGLGVLCFEGALRMLQYSLTIGGFLLHCFFNGKPYIYIKRIVKTGKRGTNA